MSRWFAAVSSSTMALGSQAPKSYMSSDVHCLPYSKGKEPVAGAAAQWVRRDAMYHDIFLDITATLARLGERHGEGRWGGVWSDTHWMNTPGPLYCGQTDNCGTGPLDAPNNILIDHAGYEFIFRQPVNRYELRQVLQAADDDPFQGYAADGDAHWSYEGVKEWWARRGELEAQIDRRYREQWALKSNKDYPYFVALQRWQDYLNTGMYTYLRVYAFFLVERRVPHDEDRLPDL